MPSSDLAHMLLVYDVQPLWTLKRQHGQPETGLSSRSLLWLARYGIMRLTSYRLCTWLGA